MLQSKCVYGEWGWGGCPTLYMKVYFGTIKPSLFNDDHDGQGCPRIVESVICKLDSQGYPRWTALVARRLDQLGGRPQDF